MVMRGFVVWVFSATLISLSAGVTSGQSYPIKPVRIVASEAGGTVDLIARLIAPGLSGALGQGVITENRPTILAIETVSKAPPDGYTLLVAAGTLWIGPLLQKMPYNPMRDFAPISLLTSSSTGAQPSVLAPGLPTIAASGVPGYEAVAAQGVFAPAGTPVSIVNRLHQEVVRFVNQADVKEKFLNAGLEAVGSSPEQLAAAMKSEIAKWGKLIREAGIRAE